VCVCVCDVCVCVCMCMCMARPARAESCCPVVHDLDLDRSTADVGTGLDRSRADNVTLVLCNGESDGHGITEGGEALGATTDWTLN
jgi:hypothetical protein